MSKINSQLDRMKAMMTYGLQTESKKDSYNSVEYQREGADGKLYGIVREGTKFYIKVSDKTKGALKEDFNYIGGFRNRKDNEYTSYANALKQFDIKMISLKEAKGNTKLMVESWNPENNEKLMVEATASMQREIARQRQIMGNAATIFEGKKNYSVELMNEGCDIEKNNLKGEKKHDACGDVTCNGGDPFTEKAKDGEDTEGISSVQKTNIGKASKPVTESEQVLGWNDNADYLDTSHGTEVGDDAPFTEGEGTEKELNNGTVAEGVAMHAQGENQNSPTVGVGEVGDDAPFTEKADNELQEGFFHNDGLADDEQLGDTPEEVVLDGEDMEDDFEIEGEEEPFGAEEEFGAEEPFGDELEGEADFESDLDEPEVENEFDSDVETRLSAIEDMLAKIAEKIGVDAFEDDELYSDEEGESEEGEFDAEEGSEDFGGEESFEDDDEDDFEVYESKNYRKMMMKEDKMDYFGKHPAYQKEPMELPSNSHKEMPDYYDMNDESVEGEKPFGQEIGDSAPFEIDPKAIENAIAESIKRILGNKKKI